MIDTLPDIDGELESELRRVCDLEVETHRAKEFINDQLLASA